MNLLDTILDQRKVANLENHCDEQTYELLVEIYRKLFDRFQLTSDEQEAVNRLVMSVKAQVKYDPALHRNNIFKAANALGMPLPSGIF